MSMGFYLYFCFFFPFHVCIRVCIEAHDRLYLHLRELKVILEAAAGEMVSFPGFLSVCQVLAVVTLWSVVIASAIPSEVDISDDDDIVIPEFTSCVFKTNSKQGILEYDISPLKIT